VKDWGLQSHGKYNRKHPAFLLKRQDEKGLFKRGSLPRDGELV